MITRTLASFLVGALVTGSAQAALHDRGNGLIYDDVLSVTWMQDANLAASNTFGVSGISGNGGMTWNTALGWIDAMNDANYLGYSDWRLPNVSPLNGVSFNYSTPTLGDTDFGAGISAPGTKYAGSTASELAFMFYQNLGNPTTGGSVSGCFNLSLDTTCLQNTGPFNNLLPEAYWFGLEFAPSPDSAWDFIMARGMQSDDWKGYKQFAWAVRDGDVAAIPEASTYAMFLAGLGLVGFMASRRKAPKETP